MNESILIIIFMSIIFVFICLHSSEVSYQESFIDHDRYLVRNFDDKKDAANTLAEIKKRLRTLIEFIENECKCNEKSKNKNIRFVEQYNKNILRKFNNIIFRESSEDNKFTSYSVNKGEEIVFCIRSKEDNKIHDINELMYVAIHEIAHVGCPEIGHTPLFLEINKILLEKAIECKIYKYKNYNLYPENYCGIQLSSNIMTN